MIIDFDSKNKGGGKEPVVEALSVTENGTYNAPSGVDGFTPVEVNVPQREPVLESLSVTDNGTYTPSSGVDGYNIVSVNVPQSGGTGFDFNQLSSVSFETNGTTIDFTGLDTSTFTSMNGMFGECRTLTSLDLSSFNTINVTNIGSMFYNCDNLKSINMSGWNTSKVKDMSYMFNGLYKIETINCNGLQLPDIDMSDIGLDSATKLTVDSIVGLLNALPTTTNSYSFQIGQTNINKLSEEQKAIAINKGWTLI